MDKLNIKVISDSNLKHIEKIFKKEFFSSNYEVNINYSEFNQVFQESLVNNQKKYDYVLLSFDYRLLINESMIDDIINSSKYIKNIIKYIKSIIKNINKNYNTNIILQTLINQCETYIGYYEIKVPGTIEWFINKINIELRKINNIILFDAENLANRYGLHHLHDDRLWNIAKVPFNFDFSIYYSRSICNLILSAQYKNKRCLVLDLDNTIWGGNIGDSGIDGINLNIGDPIGEAFIQFQKYLLELKKYGIIICICSKNNLEIAKEPFQYRKEMILQLSDISIFKADWNNKADNIIQISQELNISLSSVVFIDDNPAERHIVKTNLPEVCVPELSDDPSTYTNSIKKLNLFQLISFTKEDKDRTLLYQNRNSKLLDYKNRIDLTDYLISLNMKLFLINDNKKYIERIHQLLLKTNQFNMTNKKFTIDDVLKYLKFKNNFLIFAFQFKDIFGDHGIISVLICDLNDDILIIDNWVMSCRVFNRNIEFNIFNFIKNFAKKNNFKKIIATYNESVRNRQFQDLYNNLGFIANKQNNVESNTIVYQYILENENDFICNDYINIDINIL